MKWTCVLKKLPPEKYKSYLTFGDMGIGITLWLGIDNEDRPYEHTGWKLPYNITHWMPLPKEPRKISASAFILRDTLAVNKFSTELPDGVYRKKVTKSHKRKRKS